jgi:hypothetical protein
MKTRVHPKLAGTEKNQYNERTEFIFAAKKLVRAKQQEFMLTHENMRRDVISELTSVCKTLHQLAQRYVPNTPKAFQDFSALLTASRKLRSLGLNLELAAHVKAPAEVTDNSAVTSSFEYRILRNKFIAALATIADLTTKPAPMGEPNENGYQRGVREGYRRASDIAILFLEDIQRGVH